MLGLIAAVILGCLGILLAFTPDVKLGLRLVFALGGYVLVWVAGSIWDILRTLEKIEEKLEAPKSEP